CCSGASWAGRCVHRGGSSAGGAIAAMPAAAMPLPTACLRSATAIPPPPVSMRTWRAGLPAATRWRCFCTPSRRSSTATARAPTPVPAAVLAAKFESEAHQVRRAMRIAETAWLAEPHPDLADAYAHVRLGDSARQRLVRVETLAAKMPGHIEGALAIARAAIDASEFAKAREALAPFVAAPTQRVALLMAEIERTEHGDSGRARAWTLRAV